MRGQPDWQPYENWLPDWREKPPIITPYSAALLIVFLGAFVFLAFMALERPWVDAEPVPPDARTYADRGLEPGPPPEPDGVAAEPQQ